MIFDVAIVGAGPAGTACALTLQGKGLRVGLFDKYQFPRDKVCGDAIPAMCGRILERLNPEYLAALKAFPKKEDTRSCIVVAPSGASFEYHFQTGGWCSPRLDFDNFLLDLVLSGNETQVFTGHGVSSLSRNDGIWTLETSEGKISAHVLVGADGANGFIAKQLTGQALDADHHCAAVRQYFQGVDGVLPGRMEIHLVKGFLPGYFWIFPVGDGRCNVGFGMMRKEVSSRKISLRAALPELIQSTPSLRGRFAGAVAEGPVMGYGLPMGSRKVAMSGEGFLLCGDAAALVEPATGEGIGNAMFSGWSAGITIGDAFQTGDFTSSTLRQHDDRVYAKLWKGMRQKHLAQQWVGGNEWLLNTLIRLAGSPGPVRWLAKRVF